MSGGGSALATDLRALIAGWRADGPTDEPGLTIFMERVEGLLNAADPNATRCPVCMEPHGRHGLIHTRYGNGGGGNSRCPKAAQPEAATS